ncbi:MAG: sigma-70 family RNA polymerase sigma factor [Deferribacteres bacterium]|nr:sigma-70 family RNA polymerase sigma factor [candidate division KSB1 bacterium]MCB9512608.1 sigma-70 family RNA polymerase sigma factor [Deferribacteres bacterium]
MQNSQALFQSAHRQQAYDSQEEMIKLAQEGDEQAYRALYTRFCRVVYTLAYQMVGNHTDADEVVQETFIRVFKNIHRLRNTSSFNSWLYQIATNLSIDLRKARTKRRMLPLDESPDNISTFELATSRWVKNPTQVLENKELLKQITLAVDELPAQQKAVVILHEVEGFSKKSISEILDCSLVTVRTNLHHARKKLRRTLLKYTQA